MRTNWTNNQEPTARAVEVGWSHGDQLHSNFGNSCYAGAKLRKGEKFQFEDSLLEKREIFLFDADQAIGIGPA
jgi:hypothetical protein